MGIEISKQDWVLFKEKVPVWQENNMAGLIQSYVQLLRDEKMDASDRFWELEKRINKDRRTPGVVIELHKDSMLWDLARFVSDGLVSEEELAEFSEDVQDAVSLILRR